MNIKIRNALKNDLHEIIKLFQSTYNMNYPYLQRDFIEKDLKDSNVSSYVALEGDKIVGFAQIRPPEFYFFKYEQNAKKISRLLVHPDYQNDLIYQLLIDEMKKDIEKFQPDYLFSDFSPLNDYSQNELSKIDLNPVAFFLGLIPDYDNSGQSISIMMGMKMQKTMKTDEIVFLPPKYIALAKKIYSSFQLKRKIISSDDRQQPDDSFLLEIKDHTEKADIMLKMGNFNYSFLLVDINKNDAIRKINFAEKFGLTVQGIIPQLKNDNGTRSDKVILRITPNKLNPDYININLKEYHHLKESIIKLNPEYKLTSI